MLLPPRGVPKEGGGCSGRGCWEGLRGGVEATMSTELRTPFSAGVLGGKWGAPPCPDLLHLPRGRWAPVDLLPPPPPQLQPWAPPGLPFSSQCIGEALGTGACPTTSPATLQRGSRRLLINPALAY